MLARSPQKKQPLKGIKFEFSFDAKPKKRRHHHRFTRQKPTRKKEKKKIPYLGKPKLPKTYQPGMEPIAEPKGIDFTDTIQVTSWRLRTADMIYEKGRRFSEEGERMRKILYKSASFSSSKSTPTELSSSCQSDAAKSNDDDSKTKPEIDSPPCRNSASFSNAPSPKLKKKFCFKSINDKRIIKTSSSFPTSRKGETSNRNGLVLKMPTDGHSTISQSARRPHQNSYSVGKSRTPRTSRMAGRATHKGSRGSRNKMMFRHTFPLVQEAQQTWKIHGTKVAQSNREEMYIRRLQNLTLQKSNNLQQMNRGMLNFDYSPRNSRGQKGKKAWAEREKIDFEGSIQQFEENVLKKVVSRRMRING